MDIKDIPRVSQVRDDAEKLLKQVDDNIWFDLDKMYIVKGAENRETYLNNYSYYEECGHKKKISYTSVIFLSSLNCNLKCKYCYAGDGRYGENHNNRNFDFDRYKTTFIKLTNKYGKIGSINFFGGEPLLNFTEIKKFVSYLFDNYGYEDIPKLSIGSNGTILNDEIKEFINKYNIAFGTSIDGTKDLNDKNRIGNYDSVYDTVVDNLHKLNDTRLLKSAQITVTKDHIENYRKGDVFKWCNEIEKLQLDIFEVAPVASEDDRFKIDLSNEIIFKNYYQFCQDYSEYCISKFRSNELGSMPRIAISTLTRIMKREYLNSCSAGYSVSVTPDLMVYPCHSFSDEKKYGVRLDDFVDNDGEECNPYFIKIKNYSKETCSKCTDCISKSACSYWCKRFEPKNEIMSLELRCILFKTITENLIKFLVYEYQNYRETVLNKIHYYNGDMNYEYKT